MASVLKGIEVVLYDRVKVGEDGFHAPIYEETAVPVANVLVSPADPQDIPTQLDLKGKKAVYTLGIPKGDAHVWEDRDVEFFGQRFRTFGFSIQGIESMIPLDWNKKVMVERYE